MIVLVGSYGKTTVKNFLDQILSAKFKVVSTPKNINTEIGVAKFVLNHDFSRDEIFIVEMGAYNMGEIKLICDMVAPEIGILTAINEQHLSLFGSVENIQKAKFELLFSLPKNGLALTNADNKYCRELLPEVESLAKTFGCEKENNPDCLVKEVKIAAGGVVDFSLEIDGTEKRMSSPVVAQHNAVNIAACVLVAKHLGMSMEEISLVVGQLKLPAATLQIHQYGKSIVIDDSYNANPDGFKSALKTLNSWGNDFRKVVITRGMIELGERSEELHREIGKIIAEVADELVIIASNNEKELKNEDAKRKLEVHSIFAANELLAYVKKFENEKNVILLENLIPEIVHAELIKK